jgi:3-methylcrotonyl-CoA carboxylase alpha subunit
MFDKILIANRGEIACRIIKSARNMGIKTVAIYSSIDKDSLHVQKADSAYWVGDSPSLKSYLNQDAIIAAALESKAQAIHPGYGFLSENPQFAEACLQAGLVFIGPPVEALVTMGSKQLAKQKLEKTSVPLIPGYHGEKQDDKQLLKEAEAIGFPVLLKAANGGGGKGMRAVHQVADFNQALISVRREAMAYFGDASIIIEKLFLEPRHIEIQIMADNFGEIVHLFERDCSIQRRHQKIIEEAPASNIREDLRQQMAKAAIETAGNIGYRGAGTVEFLLTSDEQFYFMEMNTRLQVEHPVTEMITGIDCVAWQIAIAAGNPLPLSQAAIKAKGHAIECRIYAEDPAQGFIPSIGQISMYKEPIGEGVRVDSGVGKHSVTNPYYDPMLAKLICHGDTRQQAVGRMREALSHFIIGGISTNLPFLEAVAKTAPFENFTYNTYFLEKNPIELPKANPILALQAAICHDYLSLLKTKSAPSTYTASSLWSASFAWQMHLNRFWYWSYFIQGKKENVTIYPIDTKTFTVVHQEFKYQLSTWLEDETLVITTEKERYAFFFEASTESITLYFPEGPIQIKRVDQRALDQDPELQTGSHALTAPMPATIVALLKKAGDAIKKNEAIMVLEAMKMEHTIRAPEDGILAEFFYTTGEQVQEGAQLLRLET